MDHRGEAAHASSATNAKRSMADNPNMAHAASFAAAVAKYSVSGVRAPREEFGRCEL